MLLERASSSVLGGDGLEFVRLEQTRTNIFVRVAERDRRVQMLDESSQFVDRPALVTIIVPLGTTFFTKLPKLAQGDVSRMERTYAVKNQL
jgi:hypothetical protein